MRLSRYLRSHRARLPPQRPRPKSHPRRSQNNMFRTALRPVATAARAFKPVNARRSLAITAVRRAANHADHADHHAIPVLLPPGSKPGEVPTDENHAAGIERLQVLGEKEGVKVFDYEPLDASRVGTLEDPIKVFSWVRLHLTSAFIGISM